MNSLAVIDLFTTINYVAPTMLELGKEFVTYYCSQDTVHQFPSIIKTLAQRGIKIVVDEYEKSLNHSVFMADYWRSYYDCQVEGKIPNTHLWKTILQRELKVIYYSHATDSIVTLPPNGGMLCSSTYQFVKQVGPGVFMCNKQGYPMWGMAPDGGEAVVAGLIHTGQEATAKATKQELKTKLCKDLKIHLDASLPLIVYYVPEMLIGALADKGLERLASAANIIIKSGACYRSEAKAKNIHFYKKNIWGTLPLRHAADIILSGYDSGSLITNILLGLRTIPVYTRYIDSLGLAGWATDSHRGFDEKTLYNDEDRFKSFMSLEMYLFKKILHHVTPLDIEWTDGILERINNCQYWDHYDKNIQTIQKRFGVYYTETSPKIAADHIKNFLQYGTFLTKELSELNNVIQDTYIDIDVPCSALL